jgi:hypothetical protein
VKECERGGVGCGVIGRNWYAKNILVSFMYK